VCVCGGGGREVPTGAGGWRGPILVRGGGGERSGGTEEGKASGDERAFIAVGALPEWWSDTQAMRY